MKLPHDKRILENNKGSILVIALFVLTILLGIGAAFMLMVTNELRMAERQRLSTTVLYIAEAGIERGFYDLVRDLQDDSSQSPWMNGLINDINIVFSNQDEYETLRNQVDFHGGYYTISLRRVADDVVWMRSEGSFNGIESVIQAYVRMEDISPWNYAIFAGTGQSGRIINGNVDIRGSVLALGTGLGPNDYAIDMGGTAELVGNNYRTMPADLRTRVPELPKVWHNGELVETLNGTLRVKSGMVGISGNASVGEQNVAGNAYKETVDGVYVTHGFGGNQGASQVFSDNGIHEAYDLGDSITFPRLSDPYEGYDTYQAYLKANGYTLTADDVSKLNALSTDFSFGNAHGGVSWNNTTKKMTVNGILYIDNNANLNWTTSHITYSGKASFLVTGNVQLSKNILTESGSVTFPDNILGIMTPNRIDLGKNAQVSIMGMFYAENEIVVDKQTNVVGTIVSDYFNMGNNVPRIFQVPEAARKLPNGMIGSSQRVCRIVAWIKE